jgi:hypothetical protein
MLSELRRCFRHHVRAIIAPTLAEVGQADDEMTALLAALSG